MVVGRGVSITLGTHRLTRGYAPRYIDGQKPSRQDQVAIWQLEEKETDVNLALSMYRAACQAENLQLDQIVLVSGDTDLGPALAAIRSDFPQIRLGVILPHRHEQRDPPGSLKEHAHWVRSHIPESELAAFQLPLKVPLPKKPAIVKPDYW